MGLKMVKSKLNTLYLTKMEVMLLCLPQLIQMFGMALGQLKRQGIL